MAYAEKTKVGIHKSKAEIETLLTRFGCNGFAYASDASTAMVGFTMPAGDNRPAIQVRMTLPLPDIADFARTPETRQRRTQAGQAAAHEQACRSRWRALGLIVKAKLEAVRSGISTVEREFFADIVTGSGRTMHELAAAHPEMLESGTLPMLPRGSS